MPKHFFDSKISPFDYRMNRMTVHSIHFNLISLPVPVSTHILETLNWSDSVKPGKKNVRVFLFLWLVAGPPPSPTPSPHPKMRKVNYLINIKWSSREIRFNFPPI